MPKKINDFIYSEDKEKILEYLNNNNIQSFWHFTDIRNLPLIKELEGLRSKKFLEKFNIWNSEKIYPGGNTISHNLDKELDNWDKISLNFTPYTPFAYKKKQENHLIFIEINKKVAILKDVIFTNCNATRIRNAYSRGSGINGLKQVRFDIIGSLPDPGNKDWRKYVQAEILIPNHIPINMFKSINFISKASLEEGKRLWEGKVPENLFMVNPKVFQDYDYKNRKDWIINFPYLIDVIITNNKINNVTNFDDLAKNNVFKVKRGDKLQILSKLFRIQGTEFKILIKSLKEYIFNDFPFKLTELTYPNYPLTIDIPWDFKNDFIDIEFYINKILWLKRRIKVI
ncbi:MAG: DarT ssDNA thymidine ADP-ribosyltransferase family protein [Candidatus Helarchaeota archaeon]